MSLTPKQIELHWNYRDGWPAVCRANDWYMAKGRLFESAVKPPSSVGTGMSPRSPYFSDWHAMVWKFAGTIASQKHCAVTPDILRKATYWWCIGSPKSLTDFDNGDLDRVLIGFRLLCEPDDIGAVQDHQAYVKYDTAKAEIARCRAAKIPCAVELPDDPGEIRRHLFFLRKTPEAIINRLCADRFAGQRPDEMDLSDLRQLTTTLKNRRNYETRPAQNYASPSPGGEGRGEGERQTQLQSRLAALPPVTEDDNVPF